jgi:ankyrin repeat protein
MKCIFERLERVTECTVVAFFFNARGGQLEHSSEGYYRSLLHQMLERIPRLRTLLRITGFPIDGQPWEVAVIRTYLREAVLHLRHESLVLMVDALDEGDLQEIRDMVYFLDGLATSTALQGISFNICLASRHYPNVSIRLCEKLIVENEGFHTRDIDKYVQDNLHIECETQRHQLMQKMILKSKGVFMWVVLVTRRLNEQFDGGAILAELLVDIEALPDQLDTLIQGIIFSGPIDACFLPMMLWTLVGYNNRQMTPDEICFAIKFCAGKFLSPYRDQDTTPSLDHDTAKRFVLHISKGLVELVDGYRTVEMQFIHESARQHILHGGLAGLCPILSSNVEACSHAIMASWCQDYMRHGPWEQVEHLKDRDFSSLTQAFPLLSYVDLNMFDHMESAHAFRALDIENLRGFPLKHWIGFRSVPPLDRMHFEPTASFINLCIEEPSQSNKLGVATDLLRMHLQHRIPDRVSGTDVIVEESSTTLFGMSLNDFCGGRHGTPLVAAAFIGHTILAELLLDCGADVNVCSDGSIQSPARAKQTGQYVVHLHTLEGACAMEHSSPLAAAAAGGGQTEARIPLLRLLLDRGADINARNSIAGTALGAAIRYGHEEIAEMLLDRGADLNLEDSEGLNIALYNTIVTANFSERMLKLLFDRGARAQPAALNMFLHISAQRRQVRTIQALVHAGADTNYRDLHARTAMHVLAEKSAFMYHADDRGVETASLLLDLGIGINAIGGEYDTALIAASSQGREVFVRSLLHHGADVRHKSDKHGTAIDAARFAGGNRLAGLVASYKEIILMLSEAGLA